MTRIAEIFGPTFQGEGPYTGQSAMFVRFSGCDLNCSWCDTPYTWDWDRFDPAEEVVTVTMDDITDRLNGIPVRGVVLTGGEPLIQRADAVELSNRVLAGGQWFQIETNGRHAPPAGLHPRTALVASPKLSSSGVPTSKAIRVEALEALSAWGAHFKFVLSQPGDEDEVDTIAGLADIPADRIWVMPEATTADTLRAKLPNVATIALRHGWNLSTRLHVELWDDLRAV